MRIVDVLTPREVEVLTLIAQGYTDRRAAKLLGISRHTVRCYVIRACSGLGAVSRAEAVHRADMLGLLSPK